jgi:Tol biopolymer transport system component/DNA-binding winged helix-turn-helix (wHTH) protein
VIERDKLVYEFGEFRLDVRKRQLTRAGGVVPLYSKAFDLLLVLVQNSGRDLSKDELLEAVWPGQILEEANLTVTMSVVRKALGEKASQPGFVVTIPGHGYRFVTDIEKGPADFGALIIDSETIAQVTVEEDLASGDDAAATNSIKLITDGSSSRHLSRYLLVAGAVVILVVALTSLYFWRQAHPSMFNSLASSKLTMHRFSTQAGVPTRVAISPDGKSLAYIQHFNGKDSVWLGQIDSNSSAPVYQQPEYWFGPLTFSADGSSIYLTVRHAAGQPLILTRLPILGGALTEVISRFDSSVSFSPQGRQVAFLRRNRETKKTSLLIADASDGKNERSILERGDPEDFLGELSWSPDGNAIACSVRETNDRQKLIVVEVTSGNARNVVDRTWGSIDNIVWLPDGSGLLALTRESAGERLRHIWLVPKSGGEARVISGDLNIFLQPGVSASNDGKLAVIQGHLNSDLLIAPNGDPAQARRLLQGVPPRYEGVDGLAWMPNGSLLYTANVGDSQVIWSINNDGTNVRQLTPNKPNVVDGNISATSDGRYVVFQSNRSGKLEIWRANADGSNLIQLTNSGNAADPSLTPDGKSIVYSSPGSGVTTLWRLSIEGGLPTQLTTSNSWLPAVSPDGKYIACFGYFGSTLRRLMVLPFNGGEPLKSYSIPESALLGRQRIHWFPDGKSIWYRAGEQGLLRQGLDEEGPQRVNAFDALKLHNFVWSFDGKNLAYASGPTVQEIILIESSK